MFSLVRQPQIGKAGVGKVLHSVSAIQLYRRAGSVATVVRRGRQRVSEVGADWDIQVSMRRQARILLRLPTLLADADMHRLGWMRALITHRQCLLTIADDKRPQTLVGEEAATGCFMDGGDAVAARAISHRRLRVSATDYCHTTNSHCTALPES